MSLTIVSFTPQFGKYGTLVSIKIVGMTDDFNKNNIQVYLGGDRVHRVISVDPSAGEIEIMTDVSLRTGKFAVHGGKNGESATAAEDFRVGADEKLSIDGFNPTSGGAGTAVTISLRGLADGYASHNTRVYLGNEALHHVTINAGAGTIVVTIDDMARSGNFRVEGGNQQDSATSGGEFTVTGGDEAAPVITSITNQSSGMYSAAFSPNDTAVVNGRNLDAVTAVSVGGMKCPMFGGATNTRLTFRVPMAPGGQLYVSVTYGHNETRRYGRPITIKQ